MLPDPGYNIFHIRSKTGVDEGAAVSAFLTTLQEFYTAQERLFPETVSFIFGEGMIRDPYGAPTYVPDDSTTLTIGEGGAPAAAFQALVVSWRTTSATRSGRGRTFLGPISRDLTDADGTPDATAISEARAAASDLVDASESVLTPWALGVYSVKEGVFRDVTGSAVRDRWAYLSSRRD